MYNTITDFDNNYDRKENKAVFDFVDGELESCMEKITYCLETIDYDMAHDMKKEVIRQLKRYEGCTTTIQFSRPDYNEEYCFPS